MTAPTPPATAPPAGAANAFRAITRSLVETAALTGVVVRLGRSVLVTRVDSGLSSGS